MSTVKCDRIADFWKPPEIMEWKQEAGKLQSFLSRIRFFYIKKHLRAYTAEDIVENPIKGWKVKRATDEINRAFRSTMSYPGMNMSLDEGFVAASATMNPIFTTVHNKPLEGFRFFIAVDYETKCAIGIVPDLKQFTAANSRHVPGGYAGNIVTTLLDTMRLPGRWYRIWLDNFYNTEELTRHVLEAYEFCLNGTIKRQNCSNLIHFGTGTIARPTRANPKGALKMIKMINNDIYFYGYMDSAGVYFVDSCLGAGNRGRISRKNSDGVSINYDVPEAIAAYNKNMGGVDVFDQIRKDMGVDTRHGTIKWTARMFEGLWSMILTQAYNVYCYVNANAKSKHLTPASFKISVFKGMLNCPVVRDVNFLGLVDQRHILKKFEEGSRTEGDTRRRRLDCRYCPTYEHRNGKRKRVQRSSTWYCTVCKVGFHPECFVRWHLEKSLTYVPPRQDRNLV